METRHCRLAAAAGGRADAGHVAGVAQELSEHDLEWHLAHAASAADVPSADGTGAPDVLVCASRVGSSDGLAVLADVLAGGSGVCQDFAYLFICLAQLLNVPARYRVGYIYTGKDYQGQVRSDASHAWAEVYLPQIGWYGFDPANGTATGHVDYVRVATGRHYRDAAPVTGTIFEGGGGERLDAEVRVEMAR